MKTTKKKPDYTASIKLMGKTYTAHGVSAMDAISNLNPGKVNRGVSVITVSFKGNSQSKILPMVQTMRLFSPSPMTREIALKNVSLRFYNI